MFIELRKNTQSGKVFIVCGESGKKVVVVCPDNIIRKLPAILFEQSSFSESQEMIDNETITERQFGVYLEELYRQEQAPLPDELLELDLALGEMTRTQREEFIDRLTKKMLEGKGEGTKGEP